jgi:hypothetical protein
MGGVMSDELSDRIIMALSVCLMILTLMLSALVAVAIVKETKSIKVCNWLNN